MRIYQVNLTGRFSTGTIANQIHQELSKEGHVSRFAFGLGGETDHNKIETNDIWHQRLDSRFQKYTGIQGVFCKRSTERIIRDIQDFSPDLIHFHNLHGNYMNWELFLQFIAEYDVPVVLTLHDCWMFTGGCFHFTINNCYEWKSKCLGCKYLSKPYLAEREFSKKAELLGAINNLSVIAVSNWLKNMARESFLKNRDISVIHNGIDNSVFFPKDSSEIRSRLHLEGKTVLLGVASTWGEGKGLKTWIELAQLLSDNYSIVLVGLNEKQITNLPRQIIGLPRVKAQTELSDLYCLADVYINMSLEETFGLPTIEAMACGTPAVVFRSTANPELIASGTGAVCDSFDAESVASCVAAICAKKKSEYSHRCREYALNNFSIKQMTQKYIEKYRHILAEDISDE